MKKQLILLMIFLITCSFYGQEPPVIISYDYTQLATNIEGLLNEYELRTYGYNQKIPSVENGHIDLRQFSVEKNGVQVIEDQYKYEIGQYKVDGNYFETYVDGPLPYPSNNDVILLSLKQKSSSKYFNIYVRVCSQLEPGEKIILQNSDFKEGNCFYDMCESKNRFEISCQDNSAIKIDLEDIRKHKVSLKKLNRIIKDKNCIKK